MDSPRNVSKARELLAGAAVEKNRLERHLLVAAALREILAQEPVVVGGTAEEFYTAAEYHETDLDLCGRLTEAERRILRDLGFHRSGRHWVHEASKVAVEFPDPRIDGDESRVLRRKVRSGTAVLIGLDDLYLDRVRRATAHDHFESVEFQSALAVGSAAYDEIDWRYVARRIARTAKDDPYLGKRMRRTDSRVRRKVRDALASGSPD